MGYGGSGLFEAVTPNVLVDRDGNKDGASDGLVAVDCADGGDGWDGGDLDSGAGIVSNGNGLDKELC
jgi:hypothetical protein